MHILILLALMLAPANAQEHQSKSGKKQNQAKGISTPLPSASPSATVSGQVSQSGSDTGTQQSKEQPKSIWEKALAPETWSQWGVLAVAVIAAWIYWHTLRGTHRAADAAEISATAAKASADAMINSERAWVIPELQSAAVHDRGAWVWRVKPTAALTTQDVLAGKHLIYTLKLTNMGRTPAQILSFRICYLTLPEGVRELPKNAGGDLVEEREFINLLDSRGSLEIDEPINVHTYINRNPEAIRKLEKTAVIHGWVRYRHMFSTTKSCYADFCYVYTVSLDRLSSVGRHTRQREETDPPEEN